MIAEIGFDEQGLEVAFIEMKDTLVGGHVVAELEGEEWHVAIDSDGIVEKAIHKSREGAIYLVLGKLLGFSVQIDHINFEGKNKAS